MDEKTKNKIQEVLGVEMLEKVNGGFGGGINDIFPEIDINEIKDTVLMIYNTFGRETAIDYAVAVLNCTRDEVESWLPEE